MEIKSVNETNESAIIQTITPLGVCKAGGAAFFSLFELNRNETGYQKRHFVLHFAQ